MGKISQIKWIANVVSVEYELSLNCFIFEILNNFLLTLYYFSNIIPVTNTNIHIHKNLLPDKYPHKHTCSGVIKLRIWCGGYLGASVG